MKFKIEELALACILCARKVKKVSPLWNEAFSELYSLSYSDVKKPMDYIWEKY